MKNSLTEIQNLISDSPIKFRQILIFFICFMVILVDGFDVMAISLAAPQISTEWNVSPDILGYILSAEVLGMAIGAIVLSSFSDRIGRKPMLIGSLAFVTLATYLTTLTSSSAQLIAIRVLTGFGIGGVIAVAPTLASEFAPKKFRPAVVTLVVMGFAFGSFVAGVTASQLLKHYDWQALFLVGAVMGVIVLALGILFVPESLEFRASQARDEDKQLTKINETLKSLRLEPLTTFIAPPQSEENKGEYNIAQLFQPSLRGKTLLLWALFFVMFWANFSIGKWFTKLLVIDGFELETAIYAITLWVLGSFMGSMIISALSGRFEIVKTISSALIVSALAVVAYGILKPDDASLLFPLVVLFGIGMGGGLTAIYALPIAIYPVQLRAKGLGCCIGIGRVGAIASPIFTGYLVAGGWRTPSLLLGLLLPAVILALLFLRFVKLPKQEPSPA